jgi:uncharacterized protein (DUF3820 family)
MKNTLANAQVIGFFSMPSPTLAEYNPSAYYNAMADMPRNAGTCSHCGTGIMHHVIIRDESGKTRFIGTQCAEKVGIDPEALRLRKSREQINAEKAAREEALAGFDSSVFDGGKYAGRKIADVLVEDEQYVRWFSNRYPSNEELKRQIATCETLLAPIIAAEFASADAERNKVIAMLGEVWLRGFIKPLNESDFCSSVATQILGIRVYHNSRQVVEEKLEGRQMPSDRALSIMLEIKAKEFGRRNSKAYKAALEALEARLAA